ncbi:hypothetical protein [Zavarzinia sp. CC-PAN008]|uniref:hypothetical protein n=1 Tax=Zavarzinia sp. CC-PAN008 TaxID=3243332 RepID=UPI003F742919
MSEDMAFAEGCYRLDGGDWQVVIAFKSTGIDTVELRNVRWESGVTGLNLLFPDNGKINRSTVLRCMSDVLGVTNWREV